MAQIFPNDVRVQRMTRGEQHDFAIDSLNRAATIDGEHHARSKALGYLQQLLYELGAVAEQPATSRWSDVTQLVDQAYGVMDALDEAVNTSREVKP